jgi:hypothetical protein
MMYTLNPNKKRKEKNATGNWALIERLQCSNGTATNPQETTFPVNPV